MTGVFRVAESAESTLRASGKGSVLSFPIYGDDKFYYICKLDALPQWCGRAFCKSFL